MRKAIYLCLPVLSFVFVFVRCSSSDTYADKLDKQKKEIKFFIDNNDINVLRAFPSDSVFGSKDYYLHPSGTYIHVISYGNKNLKASKASNTGVTMRAYAYYLGDTTAVSNMGQNNDLNWIDFNYGNRSTYEGSANNASTGRGFYKYVLMSEACTFPLEYVGDKGEVSLIVPFENGSNAQRSNYRPMYYEKIKYNILKDDIQ